MKTTNKESIFEGNSQMLRASPDTIRPTWDRVLIRDLGEQERIGSIVIPQTAGPVGAGNDGRLRFGVVVAVGDGDKFVECGLDAQGDVRRRALPRRAPTECRPGDTVVYDRRREAEFYWQGERFSLCHEEQAVLMIVGR